MKFLGPKYIAAKSWNLPAVGYEWVIDSCVTGNKGDETKYAIEKEIDNKELIDALALIRKSNETLKSNSSFANASITNRSMTASNVNNSSKRLSKKNDKDSSNMSGLNDSSLSYPNESKRQRLENDDETTHHTSNNTPNANKNDRINNIAAGNNIGNQLKKMSKSGTKETDDDEEEDYDEQKREDTKNEDDDDIEDVEDFEVEANNSVGEDDLTDSRVLAALKENQDPFSKSNKANLSIAQKTTATPQFLTPCNPRLKELRHTASASSKSTPKENENESGGESFQTPIWMKPNDPFTYRPQLSTKNIDDFTTPQAVKDRNPVNVFFPISPHLPYLSFPTPHHLI